MKRARVAIVVLAIAAPLASLYGWNVWRNIEARERLEVACGRLDAATRAQWEALAPIARRIFEEETDHVESLFRGMPSEVCPALRSELDSPWRWNWGRTWRGVGQTPQERANLEAAMARARVTCPRVYGELLDGLGPLEERGPLIEEGCRAMTSEIDGGSAAALRGEATRSIALWDWPADLERLAVAIEAMGAREDGGR